MIGAGLLGDRALGLARDERDRLRAEALGDLQRGGAHAAGGAVHEHRLALRQAPAQQQREVGGVVVEDQRRPLGEVELGREREREELGRHGRLGEAAERAERGHAVAGLDRCSLRGARARRPPTSLPGTNGSGGFIWYWPRVCSSSGKDTPAACTSTTTPAPGVSMCEGSGSGSSHQRERAVGAGLLDDLDGSHRRGLCPSDARRTRAGHTARRALAHNHPIAFGAWQAERANIEEGISHGEGPLRAL